MKNFLLASLVLVSGSIFAEENCSWCSKITYHYANVAHIDLDKNTAKDICDFCLDSELGEYKESCSKITCIDDSVWFVGTENVNYIRLICENRYFVAQDENDSFWPSFVKALGNSNMNGRHF